MSDVAKDDMIFDIGPETAARFARMMHDAGTIVWNGPVGVFEFDQFGEGTRILGEAIAAFQRVFDRRGRRYARCRRQVQYRSEDISYISTGGGAFLEFLEGKTLPAVAMLEQRALLK